MIDQTPITPAASHVASISRIFSLVRAEGFTPGTREALREDLSHVCSAFGIGEEGAALLAAILDKGAGNEVAHEQDLAEYIGCSNIDFIGYHDHLRTMARLGIINTGSSRMRGTLYYTVTAEAMRAIERDEPFTPVKLTGLTSEELFSRIHRLFAACQQGDLENDRLLEELETTVSGNPHLVFCKKAMEGLVDVKMKTDRRIFYCLCDRYVSGGEKAVDVDWLISTMSDMYDEEDAVKRHILRESTEIQQKGLVGFATEDGLVDTDYLSLTDRVREEFFTEVELMPQEKIRHRDIIECASIQPKELFYNASEGALIARLENLLEDDHFRQVQERLTSRGMRKGFNVIFYGAPGTGKTASVYELARHSGRDIFRVDMARLKSKWVGDSEKSVRGVFKMYRRMCRKSPLAPILLFNEADAIFSRRIENVEGSVDQMSNALQNIILEEMESLEGVMIATTNLLSNLDAAFERRFIFKVEFTLPEKDSRARIWRAMIPTLSEGEADALAGRYVFSGGNIENIARKSTVEYVLSGTEPGFDALDGYCREELLNKNRRNKIGF